VASSLARVSLDLGTMPNHHENSRVEWEQGTAESQPTAGSADPDGLRFEKKFSFPEIISKTRFWIGVAMIVVGLPILRASFGVGMLVASASAVFNGLCITASSLRLKRIPKNVHWARIAIDPSSH